MPLRLSTVDGPARPRVRKTLGLWASLTALMVLVSARDMSAQVPGIEAAEDGMVLIVATRDGQTVRGSGFIVYRDTDSNGSVVAVILTSSHVIGGVSTLTVKFHADPMATPVPVPLTEIIQIQNENLDGLAVFRVRGGVPDTARPLEFGTSNAPRPNKGDQVQLLGYPHMSGTPMVSTRTFSGRAGALYVIDQSVGEGSSGGPALLNGNVIGLVTNTTTERTSVVPIAVIRAFLEGSNVNVAETREIAFTLVNQLTFEIENLWVAEYDVVTSLVGVDASGKLPVPPRESPESKTFIAQLGEDQLGDEYLSIGEGTEIMFKTIATTCHWVMYVRPRKVDLRDRVWTVDLCGAQTVTLHVKDQGEMATTTPR